jgi:dephospho-CoA kinase
MIIGVCGTFASGKDMVAEYIADKLGYIHVSTGDLVREYIRENDLGEIDRDNLRKVANELRAEHGSGYLIETSLEKYNDDVVFSGVRSTGEVETIRNARGTMIAVDAPVNQRYEWAKARKRIGDEITPEYFRQQETAEENHGDPNKQQLTAVITMSDYDIANDGTLEDLNGKIDEVLARLDAKETEA